MPGNGARPCPDFKHTFTLPDHPDNAGGGSVTLQHYVIFIIVACLIFHGLPLLIYCGGSIQKLESGLNRDSRFAHNFWQILIKARTIRAQMVQTIP
jgi:hypothetical protein